LIENVLEAGEPAEEEVVIFDDGERFLQAHGSVLRDAAGESIGALVVLHDVTRLRRLEQVRRDFAANVSHELKTPVTAIKGFVETLLDGAMDNADDARRFLGIVAAQADRLGAIIEDLLELAHIEQQSEREQVPLCSGKLREILDAALDACRFQASEKHVELKLDCPEDVQARIDANLLERAVFNLLDNAVKYSPAGATVEVGVVRGPEELRIEVRDRGCGIPREHLPRIFERFYRVDKARSRQLGGTGLGLAIVKHIAQAHQGRATVDSTPGKGSTFSIHLPLADG
jgi:two-component system phosphate regulon sensor histidine kinase PhoR